MPPLPIVISQDRKSTRLNSSHRCISYAVFCLKKKIDIPSANAMVGRGIYYGAARSEAIACSGQDVYLVGVGNSAGQAALYFSNYARRVTLLVRGRSLADSMSHYLIQQLAGKSNIEVRTR